MSQPGTKRDRLSASIDSPPLAGFDPSSPEDSYAATIPLAHRKRFGQFFTPPAIAALLADWICEANPRTVLDPAVGSGILVRATLNRRPDARVLALDVDGAALEAARRTIPATAAVELLRQDFLHWENDELFDGVILNPPYIRHQDLSGGAEAVERIGRAAGIRLSGFTNAYGLFVIEACRHLAPGGRAAMIVPGEWTNANFGAPIKTFLLAHHLLKALVYFAHGEQIFPRVLTTACLLLLEKDGRPGAVRTIHVDRPIDASLLRQVALDERSRTDPATLPSGLVVRRLDGGELQREPKWNYLLHHGTLTIPKGFVALGALATTMRGIATGANAFFHLSTADVARHGVSRDHVQPCVGRGSGVRTPIFSATDLQALEHSDRPSRLVALDNPLTAAERVYIAGGEAQGLQRRYLLGRRVPWFRAELRTPAPIWAGVFGRRGLRFVLNEAHAQTLNTFHGIYPRDDRPVFAAALAAILNSRVVAKSARALSRVYGGGLLKFEPRDLLGIPIPNLAALDAAWLDRLSALLKDLDAAWRAGSDDGQILSVLDSAVLEAGDAAAKSAPDTLAG